MKTCVQTNMPCQHVTPCKASTTHLKKEKLALNLQSFQPNNIYLAEVSLGLGGVNLVRLVPRCHVLRKTIVERELLSTHGTAVS